VREKLKTRQKHIRIADSSPVGWTTVLKYQAIEIADNSDDEKKIRSAENRALTHKIQGQNKIFHSYSNYKEIQWQQQARQHDLLHLGFLLLLQLFIHFHTNSRPFVTGPLGANHNRATFATTVYVSDTGEQTAHEETTKNVNDKCSNYSGCSTLANRRLFSA
jgi:hypothetical protein